RGGRGRRRRSGRRRRGRGRRIAAPGRRAGPGGGQARGAPAIDFPPMCGIIAVVRRPGARTAPAADEVVGPLHDAVAALAGSRPLVEACDTAAGLVESSDRLLRGAEGVWALVHDRRLLAEVEGVCTALSAAVAAIEVRLDEEGADAVGHDLAEIEAV